LPNGFVGVDEACSGVKTLQAAIMVALFLGELLRLSTRRRLVLLLLGAGWVFACNVARAATLVMVAASRGLAALKDWHDGIGTAVLVLGMAGLVTIAWLLGGGADPGQDESPASRAVAGTRLRGSARQRWRSCGWRSSSPRRSCGIARMSGA
jgi:exosortase/archaeosortase family protein